MRPRYKVIGWRSVRVAALAFVHFATPFILFSRYSGAVLAGAGSNWTTTLYGYPGQLCLVGTDPTAEGCFLWRTDQQLLRRTEQVPSDSLYGLACDIADLYHQQRVFSLPDLPGTVLEVIWLELAADDSLLVFMKPRPATEPRPRVPSL